MSNVQQKFYQQYTDTSGGDLINYFPDARQLVEEIIWFDNLILYESLNFSKVLKNKLVDNCADYDRVIRSVPTYFFGPELGLFCRPIRYHKK